jgi:putative endonuclease
MLLAPRPKSKRDPLGPRGERAAARHLKRKGYRVIGRNVHVKAGEADLICLDPQRTSVVVVEVKTRRRTEGQHPTSAATPPEASVGEKKRRKLLQVTRSLAKLNRWQRTRIDVVAVEWPDRGKPTIRHIENAVTV